jgi:hypothetical protein
MRAMMFGALACALLPATSFAQGWTINQPGQYPAQVRPDAINPGGYVVTQPGQPMATVRPDPVEPNQYYGGIVPGYRDERQR